MKTRFWQRKKADVTAKPAAKFEAVSAIRDVKAIESAIAPNDPLMAALLGAHGALDLNEIKFDSPAASAMKAQGLRMVVPLISQGELTGVLGVGARRSDQDYSSDDRRILGGFAQSAAPAVRVAQLARAQQIEAEARTRLDNELRVARAVQELLLPREIPQPDGWQMAAYWKPAREMSGDFYDFIPFPDGRLGIVVADVTDKGVPAAMVMATTRSLLRATAERLVMPGAVLERTNDALCPDMPPKMFVTCLYALLDPVTGTLHYANAGHNLPVLRKSDGVVELRATGMPLGLLPGMGYEEKSVKLSANDEILIYSDGLTEAHSPTGEMFGYPQLRELMTQSLDADGLIDFLRQRLDAHVGPDWEQEDDVTFVTFHRKAEAHDHNSGVLLAEFSVSSAHGNEREVMERVADAIARLNLPAPRVEKIKTAAAEATMNAMEHGNRYDPAKPTGVAVRVNADRLLIQITDFNGDGASEIPQETSPDLDLKLAGLQSPRGWGLFLIRSITDDMRHMNTDGKHTLELAFNL